MVAGVSRENGLEGFVLYEGAVNTERFLDAVRDGFPQDRDFVLFADNASWHKCPAAFYGLQRMGLYLIKNVPHSP